MSSSSSSSSSQLLSSVSSSEAPTYTRGVKLRRLAQEHFTVNAVTGFRFTVEALDPWLMPDEIFRFERRPWSPANEADFFDGVCSPADLEEYPPDAPDPGSASKFFRKKIIDLVFRSQSEADEAWDLIQEEVDVLVSTLNLMDRLTAAETVTIGNPSPADSSSSSI